MSSKSTARVEGPRTGDALLTLGEVSELVRVPAATLRYWRHIGEGPHSFKVGRCVRYWRAEVIEWLEAQSRGCSSRSSST
ncbi:helix-turn-helix domain-containing protein [Nocardioidaceae bacterium]|nr:helix-turn-helix domain-containing protein [Nocardioidaceae bacterium]